MNIQIFGTGKCFDTKKAQRWFKERGIKFQYINIQEKPMSRGEYMSVASAVGGYEKLINSDYRDKQLLSLISYLTDDARQEKILESQFIFKTPIVRNGRQATVGYQPEVWKLWE